MLYASGEISSIIFERWNMKDGDGEVMANGLCGSFAIAAIDSLGSGKIWGIGPSDNPSLHFFCEHNGVFFDGDGTYDSREDLFSHSGLDSDEISKEYGGPIVFKEVGTAYGQSVGIDEVDSIKLDFIAAMETVGIPFGDILSDEDMEAIDYSNEFHIAPNSY